MRIGLNLLHVREGIGGVSNHIQYIVAALQEFDRENEYVAYCNAAGFIPVKPAANCAVRTFGVNPKNKPLRVLFEQTLLPIEARRDRLDVMHWFANNTFAMPGVNSVSAIHDLLPFSENSTLTPLKKAYIRRMIRLTIRRSKIILPVSETTAADIAELFPGARDKLAVIPAPIGRMFAPSTAADAEEFKRKHGLPERFWLYVAAYYEHKNHAKLFRAYRIAKSSVNAPWPLVLRCDFNGHEDELKKSVEEQGLASNVIWLPRLATDEMPALYASAKALIFPSLYEGCGIPVLEAMSCGCPVAASDIPTTREFAENAAFTFDPRSEESIAEAMIAFQSDGGILEQYRALGLKKAEGFRPESVCARLNEAYRRAARAS